MKSPGDRVSAGVCGGLTFTRYREQDQATVPRDIIGDQVLNQLYVPLISRFGVGN